jgi:hypothetical protein
MPHLEEIFIPLIYRFVIAKHRGRIGRAFLYSKIVCRPPTTCELEIFMVSG